MSARPDVVFEFAPYGTSAPPALEGGGRVYLDVGGDRRVGVLDHHQFLLFQGSATRMVVRYPRLVRDAVCKDGDKTLTIVVHRNPDLDAVASATLAIECLEHDLEDAAERLAAYVDLVDSGRRGAQVDNPMSLYSAYAQVLQNLSEQQWDDTDEGRVQRWTAAMEKGVRLVRYVLGQSEIHGLPIEAIDAFACPGCLGRRDRDYVRQDLDRYEAKLVDPACHPRQVPLRLPRPFEGTDEVDALLVRNVQGNAVPDRVMFFKDWARTDRKRSPERGGFPLLSIYEDGGDGSRAQCWISLRPDDGVHLKDLGRRLEEAEVRARMQRGEGDTRWNDPESGLRRQVRPGFDNPDPWYDGRGHDYKILQTPNDGTVLTADEVEAILLEYGQGGGVRSLVEDLPAPDELLEARPLDSRARAAWEHKLRGHVGLLDLCFRAASRANGMLPVSPPSVDDLSRDIFVSYPRTRMDWMRTELFPALEQRFGTDRLFLDIHDLRAGAGWLRSLGLAIERARVFVPVFCADYDRSPWCQWEYEIAAIAQNSGRTPDVVPVLLENEAMPLFMGRQHAEGVWHEGWRERLLARVGAGLGGP